MTRGQIAIIYKGYYAKDISLMTSIEFNGDMYWDGHGKQVINLLKKVHDVANYQYVVAKFNNDNHHYNDCKSLTYKGNKEMLNFTKDYFKNWFSDYVYLKNITNESVEITTEIYNKDGECKGTKTTEIQPNEIVVLCFGSIEKIIKPKTQE